MPGPITDTQQALLAAIQKQVEQLDGVTANVSTKANALQSLALAFRYAAGGNQPGQVVVEK